MWLLGDELESGALVDAPRRPEAALRPEPDPAIARVSGKANAFVYEAGADAQLPGRRLHVEQPQLRNLLRLLHAEYRADDLAVVLRDPAPFARGIAMPHEVGDYLRDEGLEPFVPAILLVIQHALPVHHPPDVAGLDITQ